MKILILLVFIVYLPLSQVDNKPFHKNIDFFEIDVLANLYLVNNSELQMYDKDNKLQYTYSNLMLGKIENIDVQKSTNIFLYYKNFNKIVFLDNKLSIKNTPIDLSELGYSEANCACKSYNNAFWIFNPANYELLRFNQALEITDRTGNLSNITFYEIKPFQIIERNNLLYLCDKENGIFVFDRYGGYLRRLPFVKLDNFFVQSNSLQMLRNDSLFIFNAMSLSMDTVLLPQSNIEQIRILNSKILLKNRHGDLFLVKTSK